MCHTRCFMLTKTRFSCQSAACLHWVTPGCTLPRIVLRFALSTALVLVLLVSREAGAAAPLRWAADAEGGAPYISRDPRDPEKYIGFEVDLARALAAQLQREVVFVQYDYKSLFLGLERGDFDMAMNGLEATPDRAARYRLSLPYYIYKLQLAARRADHRFETLGDCVLISCLAGTLEETAAERMLDAQGARKRIYDGQVEPYQDLAMGRIDAVLLDTPIFQTYAAVNSALRAAGEPVGRGEYVIALRKTDEPLAAEIDRALLALAEKGELKRIYTKWNLWNADQVALAAKPAAPESPASEWTATKYLPLLFEGAKTTIFISVTAMGLAIAIALPLALMRLYGPPPVRWLAIGYVEFFRGIPVLLLLYFLYYGLPTLSPALTLSALQAAILGFGINYAAYEAEIYRAGILAVPRGQWEAAASLGMAPAPTFRQIILPQAFRVILPPMTNDFVALFKDTSLVSVIAVVELSKQYQILSKSSLKYAEIGLATAVLYLCMSVPLSHLATRLEKKLRPGSQKV